MTKKKRKRHLQIFFFMLFSFMFLSMQAQVIVNGKVKDENNDPLIGVSVFVKGTSIGTITDINGSFTMSVPKANSTIVFTYLGYKTKEITLKGTTNVNVELEVDSKILDEIVVVGYGVQKKETVTGAVSQISGKQLLRGPVTNLTSSLSGVLPGVVALTQSGQPGADGSSLLIRGSGAKYIVDGIARSIGEIDPNDVATVSVLKDASSAAVYGLDATSVVIVTTKRGESANSRISFVGSTGVSVNTQMLDLLDGPQYAYWYNKAREMDGDSKVFSDTHVRNMLAGENGWGNTNWYKKTFGTGHNSHYNVTATGGTDKIKYFTSIGNFIQDGNVSGFDYNRLNLRSNIDAVIAKNLTFTFDIAGRIEKNTMPGFGADPSEWLNVGQQALRAHPYAPEYYEGLPVATKTASAVVSPLAAVSESGYNKSRSSTIQTNFALKYDIPFIKGLSAKFMTAYDFNYKLSKSFATPFMVNVASAPLMLMMILSIPRRTMPEGIRLLCLK